MLRSLLAGMLLTLIMIHARHAQGAPRVPRAGACINNIVFKCLGDAPWRGGLGRSVGAGGAAAEQKVRDFFPVIKFVRGGAAVGIGARF